MTIDKANASWRKKIEFIKEYEEKNNDLDIPSSVLFEGRSIRDWLLRTLYRKSELNESLKSALIELGVYNNWPPSPGITLPAYEESLEYNHPDLLKFWDYEKNSSLEPKHLKPGDRTVVWWKCLEENCLVSYDMPIKHKVQRNWGCPYCSGTLRTRPQDSLEVNFPELAKCWDYDKNGDLKPIDVRPGSSRTVFWLCERGHSFPKQIRHRAQRNQNKCPICTELGYDQKTIVSKKQN